MPDEVAEIGQRFFNLNFRNGAYGTEERDFTMTLEPDYAVSGVGDGDRPDHRDGRVRLRRSAGRSEMRGAAQRPEHRRDDGARRHRIDGDDQSGRHACPASTR